MTRKSLTNHWHSQKLKIASSFVRRRRTRSVVAASPPSHLLSVPEPSQLSQSAPSIMEPLLCPNTMMQARAHIQTRMYSALHVIFQ